MISKMEKVIEILVNCQIYNSEVHNRAMNNLSKTTTLKRLSKNQTKIPYKDQSTVKMWPNTWETRNKMNLILFIRVSFRILNLLPIMIVREEILVLSR